MLPLHVKRRLCASLWILLPLGTAKHLLADFPGFSIPLAGIVILFIAHIIIMHFHAEFISELISKAENELKGNEARIMKEQKTIRELEVSAKAPEIRRFPGKWRSMA